MSTSGPGRRATERLVITVEHWSGWFRSPSATDPSNTRSARTSDIRTGIPNTIRGATGPLLLE